MDRSFADHAPHALALPVLVGQTVGGATDVEPGGKGGRRRIKPIARWRILFTRCLAGCAVVGLVFTTSRWAENHRLLAGVLTMTGLLLTGVGSAGRLWCSLYIAGYKDRRLITEGPYSMCRHPLYLFSLLGALGVGMATGTVTVPLVLTAGFLLGYRSVLAAEEAKLAHLFEEEFQLYRVAVPRFWPRWSAVHHAERWACDPRIFFRHATSVIWFPAAAGLVLALPPLREVLQLPVWLHLP